MRQEVLLALCQLPCQKLTVKKVDDCINYAGLGPDSGRLVLFAILGMKRLKIGLSYG